MKSKSKNKIALYLLAMLAKREECHNEDAAGARAEECHNVEESNALEADADGWFKASPYGVFPGKTPGRMQHFGLPEAQRMEENFNSWRGKLGRMFRGAPIFIGHPDVDRKAWPDDRRLGKFTEVQARADGIWVKPEWNSLGRENVDNGFWIYPSTRWDGPANQSQFHPDRLISIGLTNTPRIAESEPIDRPRVPIANSKDADGDDAVDTHSQQTTDTMDRKLLIEMLGLPPEATDEEIKAKLEAVLKENAEFANAEKAKLDAEGAKATAEADKLKAEDEMKAARMETANALVNLAVAEGRIVLADRNAWLPRLTGENRESEANALGALKPRLNTGKLNLEQARQEVGDESQRRETIANAVTDLQGKGMSYGDAYAAVRRDPQFKAVFDAMREPGREE
jgi:hypothetical protein